MELATQLRKRPAFRTSEFFIMVTGKNEVNLFPSILAILPIKLGEKVQMVFPNNGLGGGEDGSGHTIRGTTDVIQTHFIKKVYR